jgi:hypothetical protein
MCSILAGGIDIAKQVQFAQNGIFFKNWYNKLKAI